MNQSKQQDITTEFRQLWATAQEIAEQDIQAYPLEKKETKRERMQRHLIEMIEMYHIRYGEPRRYKEALEDMVFQFGYRGVKKKRPMIWAGGLSALEDAFEVLGWGDPHYLPEEGYTCNVEGCMEADTAGTHWGDSSLYLRLCSKHLQDSDSGKPIPKIKKWALAREERRDKVTGILKPDDNSGASSEVHLLVSSEKPSEEKE